jgi:hypothetical protein
MNIQDPQYDFLRKMPIFLNPSFDEILELAQNRWDTIRILASKKDLVLASGYGNTHSSMMFCLKKHYGRQVLYYESFILYHNHQKAYFNLEDLSGNEEAGYIVWREYFSQEQVEILRDLIRESGLSLA